jgi:hypothetical protein
MCGCDYNTRIKQKGPGRSYDLLIKYGSIDKIPGIDPTVLNHVKCRELFACKDYATICEKPDYKLTIDYDCVNTYSKEYLNKCGFDYLARELDLIYAAFPREHFRINTGIPSVVEIPKMNIQIDLSKIVLSLPAPVIPPTSSSSAEVKSSKSEEREDQGTGLESMSIDIKGITLDISNLKL